MKSTYNPKLAKDGVAVDQLLTGGRMLREGKLQNIHEQSAVQNYDIGTRLVMDDRVFRYCKAGSNLRELIGGLCGIGQTEVNTAAVVYPAGTYEVTILDPTPRAKDYYAGGYLWIMYYAPETTGIGPLYRIKSSNASVNGSVKLILETALVKDVPVSTWTTAWPNIYSNVQTADLPKASLICMPLIQVANGNYFWGQTWGPCFMQCGYHPGSKDYDRELYYKANLYGCLPGSEVVFESDVVPQRVGFLLPNTALVGTDNFFMLQLSP